MRPLPDLLLVTWEDAYDGTHEWTSIDDDVDFDCKLINTVGYVVCDTRDRLTLAGSIDMQRDDLCVADCVTIPVSQIRRRTILRKGKI